jgi:hypothetical protein
MNSFSSYPGRILDPGGEGARRANAKLEDCVFGLETNKPYGMGRGEIASKKIHGLNP